MSKQESQENTRRFSWRNPHEVLALARERGFANGLEMLQAIAAGEIPPPPIARTLDYELVEVGEGRAVFACTPATFHFNPIGSVHGGVAATLCDSAMGCAVHTLLGMDEGYSTLELKTNYLRPMSENTGRVLCEGKVLHLGRRTATAEARLEDSKGRLMAHATCTCLVFRPD